MYVLVSLVYDTRISLAYEYSHLASALCASTRIILVMVIVYIIYIYIHIYGRGVSVYILKGYCMSSYVRSYVRSYIIIDTVKLIFSSIHRPVKLGNCDENYDSGK